VDHAIENLLGVKPVYMRPPFGGLSTTAKKTLASMGYNIVLWNHDTNDWRRMSSSVSHFLWNILRTRKKREREGNGFLSSNP
jgi:peptidoglycan/xylan/chitin deacetylase (PgdA/CDA1 family)